MSYVLSVIHPPTAPATFGKAVVHPPMTNVVDASNAAFRIMVAQARPGVTWGTADRYRAVLVSAAVREGCGAVTVPSGWTFRIDPADNAPHPCPCGQRGEDNPCGRLVLPTDHAYAEFEDAYCLGCWADTVNPGCLPANTAHTEEP